jgi:hypothetical protein
MKYFTACSLLFERGLLSHDRVSAKESKVLDYVRKGFIFFSDWLESILQEGKSYKLSSFLVC